MSYTHEVIWECGITKSVYECLKSNNVSRNRMMQLCSDSYESFSGCSDFSRRHQAINSLSNKLKKKFNNLIFSNQLIVEDEIGKVSVEILRVVFNGIIWHKVAEAALLEYERVQNISINRLL